MENEQIKGNNLIVIENLSKLRKMRNLTQKELGEKLEVPVTRVSVARWETGECILSEEKLKQVSDVLNCELSDFMLTEKEFEEIQYKKNKIKTKIDNISPTRFRNYENILERIMDYIIEEETKTKEIIWKIVADALNKEAIKNVTDIKYNIINKLLIRSKQTEILKENEKFIEVLIANQVEEGRDDLLEELLCNINQAGVWYLRYLLDCLKEGKNKELYFRNQNQGTNVYKHKNWDLDKLNETLYYMELKGIGYILYLELDIRFFQIFGLLEKVIENPVLKDSYVLPIALYSTEEKESVGWYDEVNLEIGYELSDLTGYVPKGLIKAYNEIIDFYFNGLYWERVIEIEVEEINE